MVFLNVGGAISWKSQSQKCVTFSTTEVEFIAASLAGKESILAWQFVR